jgi:hypothetical protein
VGAPSRVRQIQIRARLDDPITILWADPGACIGYEAFVNGDIDAASVKYWDANDVQQTCEPGAVAPDFSHMGNTAEFCGEQFELPDGIGDFQGPVQTVNLITDIDSAETAISADALYRIFGIGPSQSGIEPWVEDGFTVARSPSSFVHLFLAESIQVPPTAFKIEDPTANVLSTQNDIINRIVALGATNPDATVGYVSGSAADARRADVKTLAYQHFGQTCGYWPDSSEGALDRANVRSGQYHFWTPGHFFAEVDDQGEIVNPIVRDLVGWFDGSRTPPEGLDVTRVVIEAGDIPQCAMRVQREGVIGAISSYAPPEPCSCYFESIATRRVPASCDACTEDSECGGDNPKCRFGFCEAY